MIKTDPPNYVRIDDWLAWQNETNAWAFGKTEQEAMANLSNHRWFDPELEIKESNQLIQDTPPAKTE